VSTPETPTPESPERGRVLVHRPTFAEREPRRHRRRRRIVDLSLAFGVPAALVGLWQLAASRSWIDPRLYPSPSDVVTRIDDLVRDGDLLHDLWVSTQRIVLGYLLGAGGAVAVGLAMGASRSLRSALEPLLTALYTVPKLALIPVFVTIFGFGEAPVLAIIAVTVFFFVWISTLAAIVSVPEGYREAARSFQVTRWQMFRHVLVPASLPQVFVGLRIAAGVSVLIMVGVEFVIADDGLGHLIEEGRTLFLFEQTYVGIVLTAIIGLVFALVVKGIGRLLAPWAQQEDVFVGR
jgi:ABC-type nitrate/sulfonate/bicarbonate transport system permease component